MKKITTIFLFIIIGISHLNIVEALVHINNISKKSAQSAKNLPADEQSEGEKESKGKDKSEEQEKYYSGTDFSASRFQLSGKDEFVCYNTRLNIHPLRDADIQPPRRA